MTLSIFGQWLRDTIYGYPHCYITTSLLECEAMTKFQCPALGLGYFTLDSAVHIPKIQSKKCINFINTASTQPLGEPCLSLQLHLQVHRPAAARPPPPWEQGLPSHGQFVVQKSYGNEKHESTGQSMVEI